MAKQKYSAPREIWKPVVGWPSYRVSSLGRVRSLPRTVASGASPGARVTPDRILRPFINKRGYKKIVLCVGGQKRRATVMHLVLEAFKGARKKGQLGRHLNGIPGDDRPENLAWGTSKENTADTREHGRMVCGEKQWKAKMTATRVRSLRRQFERGVHWRVLIRKFNIGQTSVHRIAKRKAWAHVV